MTRETYALRAHRRCALDPHLSLAPSDSRQIAMLFPLGRFVALTPPRPLRLSPAPARRCSPTRTPPSHRPRTGTAGAPCPTRTPASRPRRAPTVPPRPPPGPSRRDGPIAARRSTTTPAPRPIASPSGCVVLALADLRAFDDDVDHELVGRLVAAETRADPAGVSFERFVTVADLVEARRAVAGGLGRANAGAMARPAPSFYEANHSGRSSSPARTNANASPPPRGYDSPKTRASSRTRTRTRRGRGRHRPRVQSIRNLLETLTSREFGFAHRRGRVRDFRARARGPSAEGDAALAFSPDFFAALGWAAGARGIAFGAAASSALSSTHAPVPIASSPQTLTSADFGASVGHVDILDETFKHDLLAERDGGVGFRDETEPTGTATSSYSSGASRATRQSRGPSRAVSFSRESASIQILRASFRCADLDRRGYVPAGALCALLGAAGGFDHLTLNAAAIFLASRLASLDRERGNITHVHEREDELTLADCARHLRAALRHGTRKTGTRHSSSRGSTRSSSRPVSASRPDFVARDATREDVDALRRVFERFCAVRDEVGIVAPAHPMMMDASVGNCSRGERRCSTPGSRLAPNAWRSRARARQEVFASGSTGSSSRWGWSLRKRESTPRASRKSRNARGRPRDTRAIDSGSNEDTMPTTRSRDRPRVRRRRPSRARRTPRRSSTRRRGDPLLGVVHLSLWVSTWRTLARRARFSRRRRRSRPHL